MSKQRTASRRKSATQKGDPSGEGQSKAAIKTIRDIDGIDETLALKETYTDGPDDPAAGVRIMNPNRNTDKPDIDKPAYS